MPPQVPAFGPTPPVDASQVTPGSTPPPRRGGRPRTWLSAGLVALGLVASVGLVAATQADTRVTAGGAEVFVAPDGHVEQLAGGDRRVQIETARASGSNAFTNAPLPLVWSAGKIDEATKHHYAFERHGDGKAHEVEHFLKFTPEGVVELGQVALGDYAVHVPGRLVVPANPRPGATWNQSGKVVTPRNPAKNPADYTFSGRVDDAGGGCLMISTTEQRSTGEKIEQKVVRCPGRGVVRDQTDKLEAVPLEPVKDITTATVTRPLTQQPVTHELVRVANKVAGYPAAGMASVEGSIVLANQLSHELIWAMLSKKGQLFVPFVRKPGGDIMTVAGFGHVVVAATSQKRLVAYGPLGQRLWTAPTDDIVHTIVRLDDRTVVTRSFTGVLTAIDLATGRQVWRHDLPIGAPTEPIVVGDGDKCLVATVDASVFCLDPATGKRRWGWSQASRIDASGGTDGVVVVVDSTGRVTGRSVADGRELWTRPRLSRAPGRLVAIGTDLLIPNTDGSVVVRARDGATVRTLPPLLTAVPITTQGKPKALATARKRWMIVGVGGEVLSQGDVAAGLSNPETSLTTEGVPAAFSNDNHLLQWRTP